MLLYRIWIKDACNLKGNAIGTSRVKSFTIKQDLLGDVTSTFDCEQIPSNTKEGDILILIDPYGKQRYQGVIVRMEENGIETKQMESLFDDNWLYHTVESTSIEQEIKSILEVDFKNNPDVLMQKKFDFIIETGSMTDGKLASKEKLTVDNFKNVIYSLYDEYEVRLFFDIPLQSGQPKITIERKIETDLELGDNTQAITDFVVTTEVQEINKLILYSKEGEKRDEWYGTTNGIKKDSSDTNRLQTIRTKIVLSDEESETIIREYLRENMYNHSISFQLDLQNKLYDFEKIHMGQKLNIAYKGKSYQSLITGTELSFIENEGFKKIKVQCGKVRIGLDRKLQSLMKIGGN